MSVSVLKTLTCYLFIFANKHVYERVIIIWNDYIFANCCPITVKVLVPVV